VTVGEIEPGILDDLRASVAVWGRAPMLLTIAVGIVLAESLLIRAGGVGVLAYGLVLAFHAGWYGSERIWYLRAFRGLSFETAQVWRFVRAFMGRFIVLGLLVFAVLLPILVVAFAISPRVHSAPLSPWALWLLVAASVLLDFALTFVTPALAYSTRSVGVALRSGLAMVGREWPRSAPYVLVPPLAIQIVYRALPRNQFHGPIGVAVAVAGGVVGFAFKGAIARYYLRHNPTGDDGAAFFGAATGAPPRPDEVPGVPPQPRADE
jgi:hypothetical protein